MNHRHLAPVAALVLLLLPSCLLSRESQNAPLSPERVARLRPGESTAADVVRLLGAPSEVVQLGFRSAWRFDHTDAKRAGLSLLVVTFLDTDARSDRVWVFFDEEDRLTHLGSTFEADDAQWQLPWFERDYPEDESAEDVAAEGATE